jgi:hypothetical protein
MLKQKISAAPHAPVEALVHEVAVGHERFPLQAQHNTQHQRHYAQQGFPDLHNTHLWQRL